MSPKLTPGTELEIRRKCQRDVRKVGYQPYEPLYWAMGGPFIPVENIEAQPTRPEYMGGGMKGNARRKWVLRLIEMSEADLAKAVARYREVKEKGMEAIPP